MVVFQYILVLNALVELLWDDSVMRGRGDRAGMGFGVEGIELLDILALRLIVNVDVS
jgi:hypothetical protein